MLGLQADILEKQKEIGRLQFFAEHRPKLVLKDVFFPIGVVGKVLRFEISNVGGSGARITNGFVAVNFVSEARKFKWWSEGKLGSLEGVQIAAGELKEIPWSVDPKINMYMLFPDSLRIQNDENPPPTGKLYFFGILLYVDERGEEFGTVRRTVFRREWNFDDSSFHRTENPDHEYAD